MDAEIIARVREDAHSNKQFPIEIFDRVQHRSLFLTPQEAQELCVRLTQAVIEFRNSNTTTRQHNNRIDDTMEKH